MLINLEVAKLSRMGDRSDIRQRMAELRRKNLATWFEDRSRPEEEKSYISQLLNGIGSFGEVAARRLEAKYGMPVGYLDRDIGNISSVTIQVQPEQEASLDDAIELMSLFQAASNEGRKEILDTARSAADIAAANWRRVVGNKG